MPFIAGVFGSIYYLITLGDADRTLYNVLLLVTKDPLVFLTGFLGLVAATYFDAKSSSGSFEQILSKLQVVALSILIMELFGALVAVNFVDLGELFLLLVDGKYAALMPLLTLVYSFLLLLIKTSSFDIRFKTIGTAVSITLMLAGPSYVFYSSVTGMGSNYVLGVATFMSGLVFYILIKTLNLKVRGSA
jgi:hypothetical protein